MMNNQISKKEMPTLRLPFIFTFSVWFICSFGSAVCTYTIRSIQITLWPYVWLLNCFYFRLFTGRFSKIKKNQDPRSLAHSRRLTLNRYKCEQHVLSIPQKLSREPIYTVIIMWINFINAVASLGDHRNGNTLKWKVTFLDSELHPCPEQIEMSNIFLPRNLNIFRI